MPLEFKTGDIILFSVGSGDTLMLENFFTVGEIGEVNDQFVEIVNPLIYVFNIMNSEDTGNIGEKKARGDGFFKPPFPLAVNSNPQLNTSIEKSIIINKDRINSYIIVTNKNSLFIRSYLDLRTKIYSGIELSNKIIDVGNLTSLKGK